MTNENNDNYLRDSERVTYNPNTTIDAAQRALIVAAMTQHFQEKFGLDAKYFDFCFSNTLNEDEAEPGIRPRGFSVEPSVAEIDFDPELSGRTTRAIFDFSNDNPLDGFKTYVADNYSMTANTWEDLVAGLNQQFTNLGSSARIDDSPFRGR